MPTALITGGTTGIGRATAELLHARGYHVALTGQNPDSLAAARRELPDDVVIVRADARVTADTDALVETVSQRLGRLDLLFLNAGVFRPAPVGDVSEESFDDHVAVNFKGQYFTLQKALPLLNDGGSIVLTVGVGARRGTPGATVGAATRGALLAMLPSLALELAPRRIRVNAVSPGATDTSLFDKLGVGPAGRDALRATIPFQRFGSSREVAEVVAFLASDAAGYVTGQDVAVAGGYGLGA
ncbi:SDR family oxidoreductase [Actinoplanes xinjiangensis]|uniref:NAD(P)-dependent dehydrogenase (Short-subunit alcohol dehydrogenase family) n=1 Tax=Actinoplanes xinjiangensis TaxID=512350 RepID=A0A316F571_9ACTN|nr:SDR family oxidoreductase [Actinoplanes xinjiangensis]PWK40178.1 NAD(P)-dependent dehydrogenase (short-subunit alcohol dehydrogenase family) [Actinoplanes xinjiangensis]GIF42493.1 short-chain dehydrogenase [Actinoplanes xinjiangensis]